MTPALPAPDSSVTVLMPVIAGGPRLDAAVESILAQDTADFTLLIVDDGAPAEVKVQLAAWQARDHRIRLLPGPHLGVAGALQRGLSSIDSDYVVRMDADDRALPQRIGRQVAFLDANPGIAAVGSAVQPIDEADAPTGPPLVFPGDMAAIKALLREARPPLAHPAAAFRRRAVEAVGGYRPLFEGAEDLDLWLRLAEQHRLGNLPDVLLQHRRYAGAGSLRQRWQRTLVGEAALAAANRRREGLAELPAGLHAIDLPALIALSTDDATRDASLLRLANLAFKLYGVERGLPPLIQAADCLRALSHADPPARGLARQVARRLWRRGARGTALRLLVWRLRVAR